MSDQKDNRRKGLSLRMVIVIMFIAGVAMSGVLLSIAFRVTEQYDKTRRAENDFLACQNAAFIVQDDIDMLDERAQNFVVTGSDSEAALYFDEVQTKRSMETAVEELKGLAEEKALQQLNTAIRLHSMMAAIQRRAMRLAMEARGLDAAEYPMLLESQLTEEERALPAEAKLSRALDMLYDQNYTYLKGQVEVRIRLCRDMLTTALNNRQQSASNELGRLLKTQRTLITCMVAALFLVLVFIMTLVIYPIDRLVKGIQAKEAVTVKGASEITFLAETYNDMRGQMEAANIKLGYEAAHDALTGLYNRSAFEEIQARIEGEHIALLLLDVDFFKEINDRYGHDMGDRVLKRVGQVLLRSFREADKICRIGGDEFSVIVIGVTSAAEEIIRKKVRAAADILREPEGDVPGITFSAGCAFSDQIREGESIFKAADLALYHVKEHGRNNFAFYGKQDGGPTSAERGKS